MRKTHILVTLCCIISFGAWRSSENKPDQLQIAAIDTIVKDEINQQNLPGALVAVIRNGRIVHKSAYGYYDIEKKTPLTTNTRLRWASISKPLTAVATLQLAEKKSNFRITDKVTKHVPYWPSNANKRHSRVKITHLLSNRSGIQHYGKGRDADGDKKADKTYIYNPAAYIKDADGYNGNRAVAVFKNANLDFEPGRHYLYTTFGFNLLGAVVEEVAPNGYVSWVQNNIAQPLGMTSLRVAKTKVYGYQKKCGKVLNRKGIGSVEWKLPGGGWESNIGDLAKFGIGIVKGSLLNKTSTLWTTVQNNGGYCYGIEKRNDSNGFRVWHGGAHANVRTLLQVFPNEDYGVAIMVPADYANCSRIAARIHNHYGKNFGTDKSPTDKCDNSCSGKFAGVWRKTGKDVLIRRGYTHKEFYTEWQRLNSTGYQCVDFESYSEGGKQKWDGIFKKRSGGHAMWRNFDQAGFNKKWQEQSGKGYRLIDLETYTVGGKRKWAGLFQKRGGKYAMWRNFSTDDFKKKRAEMAKKGMKLIDIEVYVKLGKPIWSGVWIEGKDGLLNRNYSTNDFNKLWKQRLKNGYKLIDIEAYRLGTQLKWAGIWEKSSQGEYLNRNYKYCDLMNKHTDYSKKGYELLDLERY